MTFSTTATVYRRWRPSGEALSRELASLFKTLDTDRNKLVDAIARDFEWLEEALRGYVYMCSHD